MKTKCFNLAVIVALAVSMSQSPAQDKGRQKPEPSRILQALDQNRDREISAQEIASATEALMKLDRNGDGQLDASEFRTNSAVDSGAAKRTPWLLVHATELDANQDGIVEFEAELMAEARAVFAGYDQNSDGKIVPEESAVKGSVKSPLGGFVRQHAAELDRDGDGGISQIELTNQFAKFFHNCDKNGDKKLTPDEYQIDGEVTPRFPGKMKR